MPEGVKKRVYILDNLGCANCAAKMERQIRELPGVKMAVITFATKQLVVAADNQDELLPEFQRICSSIESEVTVTPREEDAPVHKKESPFEEKVGECSWEAALAIPYSAFFLHDINSLDGRSIRANFYKCGDLLQKPHFLSWNPIPVEKPDFHRPDHFGLVNIE